MNITSVVTLVCGIAIFWRFRHEFGLLDWALLLSFSVLFAATEIGGFIRTADLDILNAAGQLGSHI
jgi:hypothetical protein